ncbi:MAG: hypothetical protein N3D11_02195 [Candidatus Sumerlaeia bacterium]|nr:hypothetical protein [Candidatus Sumerlaeia bacterium]
MSDSDPIPFPLDENHRRAVSSTLAMLDRALCLFQRWAEGNETKAVMYREENTLHSQQRAAILDAIRHLRALLAEVCAGLALHKTSVETAQAIRGHCAVLWEALEGIQSKALRAYGKPPPQLRAYLDPRVEQMIYWVRKMLDIAATPPNPEE